jgi:hypothetical protein
MAVTKITANGEQIVVDVAQWNPVTGEIVHEDVSEVTRLADEALKLGDIRMVEMNTRMLEAYNLEKFCHPTTWAKILSVLDILSGRVSADVVARRWQSEIEENEELEAGRLTAMNKIVSGSICYKCHKSSDIAYFSPTNDDPLAQVCDNCKTVECTND